MSLNEKEYLEKLSTTVSKGFQSLLLAAAFKLKLFDLIDDETQPRTSQQIADLGNYKERYVREWLGGMVTGGFVECDPSGTTYWLTSSAKKALQSQPGHDILAMSLAQPWLAFTFDKIMDCFKSDGPRGLPYSECGSVHEMSSLITDAAWKKNTIPHYVPKIPDFKSQLEKGINCVEIGFGSGTILFLLAEAFPKSQFLGVDLLDGAIDAATKLAAEKSLSNIRFVKGDAKQLPADWTSKFDYAMSFKSAHDFDRVDLFLKETVRILKPGGRLWIVEVEASSNVYKNIADKRSGLRYACSLFHCMPVSYYFPDGLGLGVVWGVEKATSMFNEAGFAKVEKIDIPCDVGLNMHFICTK